jgi:hypothetical protein
VSQQEHPPTPPMPTSTPEHYRHPGAGRPRRKDSRSGCAQKAAEVLEAASVGAPESGPRASVLAAVGDTRALAATAASFPDVQPACLGKNKRYGKYNLDAKKIAL